MAAAAAAAAAAAKNKVAAGCAALCAVPLQLQTLSASSWLFNSSMFSYSMQYHTAVALNLTLVKHGLFTLHVVLLFWCDLSHNALNSAAAASWLCQMLRHGGFARKKCCITVFQPMFQPPHACDVFIHGSVHHKCSYTLQSNELCMLAAVLKLQHFVQPSWHPTARLLGAVCIV
jgi:hypothetical protein